LAAWQDPPCRQFTELLWRRLIPLAAGEPASPRLDSLPADFQSPHARPVAGEKPAVRLVDVPAEVERLAGE